MECTHDYEGLLEMPFKLFIHLSLCLFLALAVQLSLETKNRKALRLLKRCRNDLKICSNIM